MIAMEKIERKMPAMNTYKITEHPVVSAGERQ
jgi:hypothetical protein